jgi:hypothetical protein
MKKLLICAITCVLFTLGFYRPALVKADTFQVETLTWTAANYVDDVWGLISNTIVIPTGAVTMYLCIPFTTYNSYIEEDIWSAFYFEDSTSDLPDVSYELAYTYSGLRDSNNSCRYLNLFQFLLDYDEGDQYVSLLGYDRVTINVMMSFTSVPSGFEDSYDAGSYLQFTIPSEWYTINVYDKLVLYRTYEIPSSYLTPPPRPTEPTPTSGFEFVGWRRATQEWYYFDTIDPSYFTDNVMNLYSVYQPVLAYTPPTETDPDTLFEDLLTAFGLFNTPGLIFIYFVIIFIITLPLLFWRLPVFIFMIVDILVTAIFMFLGFLPIFVIIVMFMIFAAGIFFSLKRGASYE